LRGLLRMGGLAAGRRLGYRGIGVLVACLSLIAAVYVLVQARSNGGEGGWRGCIIASGYCYVGGGVLGCSVVGEALAPLLFRDVSLMVGGVGVTVSSPDPLVLMGGFRVSFSVVEGFSRVVVDNGVKRVVLEGNSTMAGYVGGAYNMSVIDAFTVVASNDSIVGVGIPEALRYGVGLLGVEFERRGLVHVKLFASQDTVVYEYYGIARKLLLPIAWTGCRGPLTKLVLAGGDGSVRVNVSFYKPSAYALLCFGDGGGENGEYCMDLPLVPLSLMNSSSVT